MQEYALKIWSGTDIVAIQDSKIRGTAAVFYAGLGGCIIFQRRLVAVANIARLRKLPEKIASAERSVRFIVAQSQMLNNGTHESRA